MIQEYYAFFYNKTKSKIASRFAAFLIYLVKCIEYGIKCVLVKSNFINVDNPREIIESVYSKPDYKIEIANQSFKAGLDASVIIPVYNYKDVINCCIDSVINQITKYNYEVILVDDGSTDGSSDIVDTYSKYDNVVIIHKENGGIASARNAGLDVAKGNYVMFVDCDDYVHNDYVETLLNEAYRTNCDIVICGYTLIKMQNNQIISERDVIYSEKNLMHYDSDETIMNYQGLPWNKTYKRDLFQNIRYIPGYWYEDTIIHFLVFRVCNSYSFVDKSLYDYMWYENNFSHTQTKVSSKSLQRYWFLEVMRDETVRIRLDLDHHFYKVLLRHCGSRLKSGIGTLDSEIKNAAFVQASNLLNEYKPQYQYKLSFFEKELEKALLTCNINKWELVSNYI